MAGSVILGSSAPTVAGAAELEGPDIESEDDGCTVTDARLFRVGEDISDLPEESAVVGRVCEGDILVAASSSVRSARFDIGDRGGTDAQLSDIEVKEKRKAG